MMSTNEREIKYVIKVIRDRLSTQFATMYVGDETVYKMDTHPGPLLLYSDFICVKTVFQLILD